MKNINKKNLLSLYIHWPYCDAKCPYCDFNSHVKEAVNNMDWITSYTNQLNEMKRQLLEHNVKFKREIKPGEKLIIKTKVLLWKRGICDGYAQGFVEKELACEANMKITIPEILESFLPKKSNV